MAQAAPTDEDLFAAAAELLAAARPAFLDQSCPDPAQRARVEALLLSHEGAGSFLGQPLVQPPTTVFVPPTESPGALIGRYKLIELLGEGGMGTLWMAQQTEPVKRLVALKVIKAGMDSKQVLGRFEAERQALALMDHPNIAKVLDAGATPAGRPYFVMELVKGLSITRFCDEHRLTPRQRLELFVPVCHAIQHAHQKGIIHRDIKPSNVLVALYDDRPVPKVIDFGVAKATGRQLSEQTLHTGFGSVVGTMEYMSPEQATFNQLDVDTRSDIYSLGVLLYELLAGSPPFSKTDLEQAGVLEMLRVIREQEPSKPSTKLSTADGLPTLAANRGTEPGRLTKLVRGELDWIVMKALEKDRSRRYETANGFAMDVQRYLAGEAVQAVPASVGYRLKKFVRRNKGPVLAVSLVLLALVAGIVGTTWQAIRAANRAEGERLAKERAETNFDLANQAVETYLGRVAYDPELSRVDLNRLRKKLLESAVPFLQKLAAQKGNEPEVEAGRGRAYLRLAFLRMETGENEAGIENSEAARAIFTRLADDFPDAPAYRQQLATSDHYLGLSFLRLGKDKEAEAAFRRAISVGEELADRFPNEPKYRLELSNSLSALGSLLQSPERLEEREAFQRRALDIRQKLVDEVPTDPDYRHALAQSHNNRGTVLAAQRKLEEAEAAYRRAIGIREKLVDEFPNEPEYRRDLAKHLDNLGHTLRRLNKREDEEAAHRRALAIWEKLAREFPTVPEYRHGVGWSHDTLAVWLEEQGKGPAAEAAYRRALDIREKLVADFPTVRGYRLALSNNLSSLGSLLQSPERLEEREAFQRRALDIREKLVDEVPTDPDYRHVLAQSHNNLGTVLADQRKLKEAEAEYRRAIGIQEKLVDEFPNEPGYRRDLAKHLDNLGHTLRRLNKREDAEATHRRALAIWEKLAKDFRTVPAYAMDLGGSYCDFAHLIRETGQPKSALDFYQKAIATLEPLAAKEPPPVNARRFLRNSHLGRAEALDALGRHAEAVSDWERALKLDDGSARYELRLNLAFSRLRGARQDKDAGRCLAAADEYEAMAGTDALWLYDAACARAICAAVIPLDPKTPAADAAGLAKKQADRAMAWLRKAIAAGFADVAHLKEDEDLDALRESEDFKKLLGELEAKKK